MDVDDSINKIWNKLEEHENRIKKLEESHRERPTTVEKKQSINEFLLLAKPDGDIEKTLVIGYYLEKNEWLPFFNIKDLKRFFKSTKSAIPENINDKVNKNIAKGLMVEMTEKKEDLQTWSLTTTGEKLVEMMVARKSE